MSILKRFYIYKKDVTRFITAFLILFFCISNAQPANKWENQNYRKFPTALVNFIKKVEINNGQTILLSAEDAELYTKIFNLQNLGKWNEADRLIGKIDNKILLGHVNYQRLMHPTKYRSSFKELKLWLDLYSDHPMSDRIWKLANKRRPSNIKSLNKPGQLPRLSGYGKDTKNKQVCEFNNSMNKHRNFYTKIKKLIKRGRPTQAVKLLVRTKGIDKYTEDDIRGRISAGYFAVGKDKISLQVIAKAADRSGASNPILYWRKGLVSYRLGLKDMALNSFTKSVAVSKNNYCRSASAYWAAKMLLKRGQEEDALKMFNVASKQPLSFYGQLAIEALGINNTLDWSLSNKGKVFELDLSKNIHFLRAVALSQVRRYGEADQEFRFIVGHLGLDNVLHLVELAEYLNLPAVQLRLGDKLLDKRKEKYNVALYPDPQWIPLNGLKIDRALLWAIIKNESAFYLKAKSHRGARGVMQIMPSTARIITGDRSLRGINSWKLYDLDLNIRTGQDLIIKLLKSENVGNSLVKLLTAWNAGSSNLKKWHKKISIFSDPLLYIESIPSSETRLFVKKVLSDLWIYRDRFEQNKVSLWELANNRWPKYLRMEN